MWSKTTFVEMEAELCQVLDWNLVKAMPVSFYLPWSALAWKTTEGFDKQEEVCASFSCLIRYFAHLPFCIYERAVELLPSMIAASAVFLATRIVTGRAEDIWNESLQEATSYKLEDLLPCLKSQLDLHQAAPKAKLRAVYEAFATEKRYSVARTEIPNFLLSFVEELQKKANSEMPDSGSLPYKREWSTQEKRPEPSSKRTKSEEISRST
jgi:hypothetical protein